MQRKKSPRLHPDATKALRNGIFLDLDLATELLRREGATTVRDRARELQLGVSTVHDLWKNTRPVGDEIVYAFRVRFPEVPYERLFKERQGVLCHVRPATSSAAA